VIYKVKFCCILEIDQFSCFSYNVSVKTHIIVLFPVFSPAYFSVDEDRNMPDCSRI